MVLNILTFNVSFNNRWFFAFYFQGNQNGMDCGKVYPVSIVGILNASTIKKRDRPLELLEVIPKGGIGQRVTLPAIEIRYDGINHWSKFLHRTMKKTCKMSGCTSQTQAYCIKCNVHLCCTTGKTCFMDFHTKSHWSKKMHQIHQKPIEIVFIQTTANPCQLTVMPNKMPLEWLLSLLTDFTSKKTYHGVDFVPIFHKIIFNFRIFDIDFSFICKMRINSFDFFC